MPDVQRTRHLAVLMLLAIASFVSVTAVNAQGSATDVVDVVSVTSPDGLVTIYVPTDALAGGVQPALWERAPQDGPPELRNIPARTVLYRLGPRSADVNVPITIVRSYRTEGLGFEADGVPVISQAIKGPDGWRWLDEQRALSAPLTSVEGSTGEDATRAQMAEFLRRSLGLSVEAFQDPFADPTIDLVVAGTTDRLGDLIGIGGGVFLSQEPRAPVAMSVGDRRALHGKADVNQTFGGRATGLALIVEPPDVAVSEAQALYPDRSYAAVIGCDAEGQTLAFTEVTMDRLARRVSLFDAGPLAALSDGAEARVYLAQPITCRP
jgi:hypothetical protein